MPGTSEPDSSADPLLDFAPVPRRAVLTKGWTAAKQRDFIAALRETGSVRIATEAVGMSHCGVYKLRHQPGGEGFARAWDEAVGQGARRVRDVLIDQAVHGIPERVVIGGHTVIERRRFNHRTMIWVLQHHMPDEYPGGSTLPRRTEPQEPIEAVRARVLAKLDAIEAVEGGDAPCHPARPRSERR